MRNKAQSSIEFTVAFVGTILFLILTCNLFVWFNHCLVERQQAYEQTRQAATVFPFLYDEEVIEPPRLNVFTSGGYQ